MIASRKFPRFEMVPERSGDASSRGGVESGVSLCLGIAGPQRRHAASVLGRIAVHREAGRRSGSKMPRPSILAGVASGPRETLSPIRRGDFAVLFRCGESEPAVTLACRRAGPYSRGAP